MKRPRYLRLFLLAALLLLAVGFLLYYNEYPRFSAGRNVELQERSAEVFSFAWPHRAMTITLTVSCPEEAMDVYVLASDNREDRQVAYSDGLNALSEGKMPANVWASQREIHDGQLTFKKQVNEHFRILVVNPAKKKAPIKFELLGRSILALPGFDLTLP
jgi:hypothetical protein